MISYHKLYNFKFESDSSVSSWISQVIANESFKEGDINYIFCDDSYLLDINIKYLKHNTLTDIISFDYTLGKLISGDIFISIERVMENTFIFNNTFSDELHRVIIHGILHFCGYKDKSEDEKKNMRKKEDYYLSLRTF